MTMLTMGVIGTSKKEDERRLPIHPEHLKRLPENIRKQLIFEKGYGAPFQYEMMKKLLNKRWNGYPR